MICKWKWQISSGPELPPSRGRDLEKSNTKLITITMIRIVISWKGILDFESPAQLYPWRTLKSFTNTEVVPIRFMDVPWHLDTQASCQTLSCWGSKQASPPDLEIPLTSHKRTDDVAERAGASMRPGFVTLNMRNSIQWWGYIWLVQSDSLTQRNSRVGIALRALGKHVKAGPWQMNSMN